MPNQHKPWSPDDDSRLSALYANATMETLVSSLGDRSPSSIRQRAHLLGLRRVHRTGNVQEYKPIMLADIPEMERGYIAGIFDSEGCIGFYSYKRDNSRYRVNVTITNTSLTMIDFIQERIPGSITVKRAAAGRWRETYLWRLGETRALQFVREITPYLVAKKPQAETIGKGYIHLSQEERDSLCLLLKGMKRE